jgi:NAD(P)-dependent dehydrogenase (short-subunit alcohol dehydrogenase family)
MAQPADVDMRAKIVVITGGNAGIGKHAALALTRMGATVIITARDPSKGAAALAELRELAGPGVEPECMALDLANLASIDAFAAELLARYPRIDVLVLNAGLILDVRSETVDGFETTFGVNHLGHFHLTALLRERLLASAPARVVVVSSAAHKAVPKGLDFDDLMSARGYQPFTVYSRSKLANIYFSKALARRLAGTGVTVNALHPGTVRTRFARDGDLGGRFARFVFALITPFMISVERGARTSVYLASAPELAEQTGGYYARCKPAKTTSVAQDEAAAERLWAASEALLARRALPPGATD